MEPRVPSRRRLSVGRPGAEPVPGYRLLRSVGSGGSGEVWRAEAPGGLPVALKLIRLSGKLGGRERSNLRILRAIRHPNLLAYFGAWTFDDLLVIGMELADRSLWDRFKVQAEGGLAGIPLERAAECPGRGGQGHRLPQRATARAGREGRRRGLPSRHQAAEHHAPGRGREGRRFRPVVARCPGGDASANDGLTYAYAAPETFRKEVVSQSDQYSLAVTYCVLRGGRLPFTGPPTVIMLGHLFQPPDLTMLPERGAPGRRQGPRQGTWRAMARLQGLRRGPEAMPRGRLSRADPDPGRGAGRGERTAAPPSPADDRVVRDAHGPARRLPGCRRIERLPPGNLRDAHGPLRGSRGFARAGRSRLADFAGAGNGIGCPLVSRMVPASPSWPASPRSWGSSRSASPRSIARRAGRSAENSSRRPQSPADRCSNPQVRRASSPGSRTSSSIAPGGTGGSCPRAEPGRAPASRPARSSREPRGRPALEGPVELRGHGFRLPSLATVPPAYTWTRLGTDASRWVGARRVRWNDRLSDCRLGLRTAVAAFVARPDSSHSRQSPKLAVAAAAASPAAVQTVASGHENSPVADKSEGLPPGVSLSPVTMAHPLAGKPVVATGGPSNLSWPTTSDPIVVNHGVITYTAFSQYEGVVADHAMPHRFNSAGAMIRFGRGRGVFGRRGELTRRYSAPIAHRKEPEDWRHSLCHSPTDGISFNV